MEPSREATAKAIWAVYWRDRSDGARNALFCHYSRLMHSIAFSWLNKRHLSHRIDEVVSRVSERVLTVAIPRFDPDMGFAFHSYLHAHVIGAIKDCLRETDTLSRSVRTRSEGIESARTRLSQTLGHRPTDAELAEHLGIDEEYIVDTTPHYTGYLRTETADYGDGEEWTPSSKRGHDIPGPAARPQRDYAPHFDHLTRGLSKRRRLMLWLYYFDRYTMRQIGEQLDVSQSYVSMELRAALKFLRENRNFADAWGDIKE